MEDRIKALFQKLVQMPPEIRQKILAELKGKVGTPPVTNPFDQKAAQVGELNLGQPAPSAPPRRPQNPQNPGMGQGQPGGQMLQQRRRMGQPGPNLAALLGGR